MTVIAGFDDGTTVSLGSDTQGQTDSIKFLDLRKVYRIGPCLVGAAGSSLWYDFLQEQEEAAPGRTPAASAYWGRPFVLWLASKWHSWAKERGHGCLSEASWYLNGSLLCATPHGLFVVDCMGSVRRCHDYHAIGSGADVALGALCAVALPTSERMARAAVKAANRHAPGCGGVPEVRSIDRRAEPENTGDQP